MFDLRWVSIWPAGAALQQGTTVAVAARTFGLWSLNACRVVYVESFTRIDRPSLSLRAGA